jgi:hypothetical protein
LTCEEGEAGLLDGRLGQASGRRVPVDRAEGSRHEWLESEAPLDLIVTLDDATGAICSAFLIEEEGTASTFRGLSEVFSQHGLPMSLYTDRGSHYFRTAKAGEIDRGHPTQVGRALEQLGVEHIGAYSPHSPSRDGRPSGRPLPGAVRGGHSGRCRIACPRSSSLPA